MIIQIGYFKLTGGKRLFRMSPLHHHFELGGWDEEKITLRFWIVGILAGAARRDAVPRLDQPAARERADDPTTARRPIDLDALTLGGHPRRRAARPSRSRSSASRGAGIALARFLADAGADVTVYDGRPAAELGGRDRRARGPAGPARARPRRRPGLGLGRRGARRRPRPRSTRTSRRPSRGSARRSQALVAERGAGRRRPGLVSEPDLFLRLCPAPTDRRHRHEGQDDDRRR